MPKSKVNVWNRKIRYFFIIKKEVHPVLPPHWYSKCRYIIWVPLNNDTEYYGFLVLPRRVKKSEVNEFFGVGDEVKFIAAWPEDYIRQSEVFLANPKVMKYAQNHYDPVALYNKYMASVAPST